MTTKIFIRTIFSKTLTFVNLYPGKENLGDVVICRLLVQEARKYGIIVFNYRGLTHEARRNLGLEENEIWSLSPLGFKLTLYPLLLLRTLLLKRTYRREHSLFLNVLLL